MTTADTPAQQRKPREKVASLGIEIYERDILPQVEADHHSDYVASDVHYVLLTTHR